MPNHSDSTNKHSGYRYHRQTRTVSGRRYRTRTSKKDDMVENEKSIVSGIIRLVVFLIIAGMLTAAAVSFINRSWQKKNQLAVNGLVREQPQNNVSKQKERIKLLPAGAASQSPQQAELMYKSGQAAAKAGDFEDAEAFLRQALVLQPSGIDLWMALGAVHLEGGRYDRAMSAFLRCRELETTSSADVVNNIGVVHLYKNEIKKAEEFFNLALALSDDYPPALFNLALSAFAAGRIDTAMMNISRYLKKRPDDPVALREQAFYMAAEGQYPQAINLLERAILLQPGNAALYFDAAAAYALEKNMGKTADLLKRAENLSSSASVYAALRQRAYRDFRQSETGRKFAASLMDRLRNAAADGIELVPVADDLQPDTKPMLADSTWR